ncbi:hypothetical protein [Streptomyces sp. NBC_01244]|uniref:hypothetical protein n=1 Tax=Streptomyces sp. NBC_01244 TaxID=2903797 RepID=UPI002E132968|nr:hypothetical protein OG247_25665 [Streptomyces sp. NBC_01244]
MGALPAAQVHTEDTTGAYAVHARHTPTERRSRDTARGTRRNDRGPAVLEGPPGRRTG